MGKKNKDGKPRKAVIRTKGLRGKLGAFVVERIKDPKATPSEIGRRAGYAQPANGAYRAMKSAKVRAELQRLMDKHPELTLEGMTASMADQMKATKMTYKAHEGIITDEREDADWTARHAAREQGLKIRGAMLNEEVQAPQGLAEILIIIKQGRKTRGLPEDEPIEAEVIPGDHDSPVQVSGSGIPNLEGQSEINHEPVDPETDRMPPLTHRNEPGDAG